MDNSATDSPQTTSKYLWDAALYDSKHSFVSQYGTDLVELLSPQRGERILDLGCGTGHLSHRIASAGAEVIAIDSSPAMIERARESYLHLRFEAADATDFHFSEPFDAVFSNAVLHWIKEPERAIACIWRALKPGGRFVAEFGGKGNIKKAVDAIYRAIETAGYPPGMELNPWYFPSIGEFGTLLEKQGFCLTYATLFDRPTPLEDGEKGLRHWIEMFTNVLLERIPNDKRADIITDVEDQLRPELFRNGTWVVDYRRIRAIAIKEHYP